MGARAPATPCASKESGSGVYEVVRAVEREEPGFGRRVALVGETHFAVSSDTGVTVFFVSAPADSAYIPQRHTCLAADSGSVFLGIDGQVREYREVDEASGWVLVTRYLFTPAGAVVCDADAGMLLVGNPDARVAGVFETR